MSVQGDDTLCQDLRKNLYSYTSLYSALGGYLREFADAFSSRKDPALEEVFATDIRNLTMLKETIEDIYQQPFKDRSVLDIGAGELLKHSYFFAQTNRVTALHCEGSYGGASSSECLQLSRKKPLRQCVDGLGHQLQDFDRNYRQSFRKHFGAKMLKKPKFVHGDATDMPFADQSFDVIMSCSVFEYAPSPLSVLREIRRVLRPGGVVYIGVHPFLSEPGDYEQKIFGERDNSDSDWAHLHPKFARLTQANAYCHQVSIPVWKSMLTEIWPGCSLETCGSFEHAWVLGELKSLGTEEELIGYANEELLTDFLVGIWIKPAIPHSGPVVE